MENSIKIEIIALVILGVIFIYHWDRQNHSNTRYQLYTYGLTLSMIMIVFNIASILMIMAVKVVPYWLNMLINTGYFIVLDMTFSVVAIYCFYIMFEYASDKHCFYIATGITISFAVLLLLLNITNFWTGWIFHFTNGVYMRGPLNKIGFLPLVIEVGMFCACYIRNKSRVGSTMNHVIQTIPPLVLMIVIVQIVFPDTMFTGMMAALVNMVLFINFQSSRNGRDALTGLANRVTFTQDLQSRKKKGQKLHLVMVYLEKYEEVNKKFGVKLGDTVLFQIAGYLNRKISGYNVCRFGNTTFLMMTQMDDRGEAERLVEQIKKRFELPWGDGDIDAMVRVSIAHRLIDFSDCDENTAVDQLEYTISLIRENGGNACMYFGPELKYQYERKEYVLRRVKKAIDENSFQVYFQPIYDCAEDCFRTAESLLRLQDTDGSFISPAEFIPLAEKNGLMDDITWIVLEKVCRFFAENRELPIGQISVNMACQQLLDLRFEERLRKLCSKYKVGPEKLRIEITERTMVEDPQRVREIMMNLGEMGIRFYLDDFGIGYSNLAMMLEMPFETVKLDSSLIANITKGERKCHTVKLLVELLHNSGLIVVAEGIEEEKENQTAKELTIDMIQGFYHARPMPGDAYVEFLKERNPAL